MSSASQGDNQTEKPGLEDRLRGLILGNAQPITEDAPKISVGATGSLPPHMIGASVDQQEEYLRKSQTPPARKTNTQSTRGGRKRLNQAQRRQVNSQLQIPFDSKPAHQVQRPYQDFHHLNKFSPPSHHYGQPTVPQIQTQYGSYQGPPQLQNVPSNSSFYPPVAFQQQPSYGEAYQPHMHQQQVFPSPLALNANSFYSPGLEHQQSTLDYGGRHMSNHFGQRSAPRHSHLYQPGALHNQGLAASFDNSMEEPVAQNAFLEALINDLIPRIASTEEEIREKEMFRATIEQLCRDAIFNHEKNELGNPQFDLNSVEIRCYGSTASGFATKASDMDLALLTPLSQPPPTSSESSIPRLLEKKLLDTGFGARLLTRTRVPIIKVCQKPTANLLSDLLDERMRWENGFKIDVDTGNEEGALETLAADHEVVGKIDRASVSGRGNKSTTEVYEEKLNSLRQKPNQPIREYYYSAQRLLRKLGGRDSGVAQTTGLSVQESKLLADVGRAFVNGLSDDILKTRLLACDSFARSIPDQFQNQLSLGGVFAQMQGEQFAIAWDSRPFPDVTSRVGVDHANRIEDWKKLLNNTDMDTSAYNRALHQALERVRRIPSLQLFFLEQGSHEDAVQYHARASRILNDLRATSTVQSTDDNHMSKITAARYIAGVRGPKVQEALRHISSHCESITLDFIALQQRILQLADDYESALAKRLYAKNDRSDVEEYIKLLRSGSSKPIGQSPLLATEATWNANGPISGLIARIRTLGDPSPKNRDRYRDHLEFPKTEVGVQCDINFSAELGLHNTLLLRCYSLCDPRVKPIILFVKHWAKVRAINTPYRGTLSSYGYVLMVLHYLVNVSQPFVCPNLQQLQRNSPPNLTPGEIASQTTCSGCDVRFWRNEKEITHLAEQHMLNHNLDSTGKLLREFFEYFANTGPLSTRGRGFDWGREVLSLRTMGGLLSKQEKGWVGAKTVTQTTTEAAPVPTPASPTSENIGNKSPTTPRKPLIKEEIKEIRHRYLFAIEDPFELDHNVARTVTHNGIVSIRDEFRRAWRIIRNAGKQTEGQQEGLLDPVINENADKSVFLDLVDLIHGKTEVKA